MNKLYKTLSVLSAALITTGSAVAFAAQPQVQQLNKLTPFVDCLSILDVDPESGYTMYFANFGYTNSSKDTITLPYGPTNTAQPWSVGDYNWPTTFTPGTHHFALTLSMFDHMEWTLGSKKAVADRSTTPVCN